jgi:3-dehydroquinate synthase
MALLQRSIQVDWQLRVFFTEDVFAPANPVLQSILVEARPRKVLVVLEDSLALAQPRLEEEVSHYFRTCTGNLQLTRSPIFVSGGERAKYSQTIVNDLLSHLHRHHIDRHSYLVAIGGGALLDVVGFAAATAHRGVRLVRIPTTTLSQADSGVGIKNGLNAFGQKNFMGAFAPPFAVINDFNLLATLPPRDKRAGYAEAVKVACIRDAAFFDEIEAAVDPLSAFHPPTLKRLIYRCAELHLDHIATCGDPFETGSARPLDFGHWAAHKLEMLTRSRLSHGEAVAIGIALDVVYSRRLGWLDARSADRILNLLERLGFTLFAGELLNDDSCSHYHILDGLEEFREHLGGSLTITLLRGIGRAEETHEMQPALILEAVQELRQRAANHEPSGCH